MRKFITLSLFAIATCAFSAELTTTQKESYAIGASTGSYISNQLHNQAALGVDADVNVVIEGLIDALKNQTKMKDEQIISVLNERADKLNKIATQKKKEELENNKKLSKEFMSQNAKNKKVKTTKSGLQYEILALGEGEKPKQESIVVVNYKAYLPSGEVFENTYDEKIPAHLSLISVIEGFKEGLMLMNAGSKYKLTIPSDLAYGDEGVEVIPAGSAVVFEVELIKVLKPGEFADAAKELSEKDKLEVHKIK